MNKKQKRTNKNVLKKKDENDGNFVQLKMKSLEKKKRMVFTYL